MDKEELIFTDCEPCRIERPDLVDVIYIHYAGDAVVSVIKPINDFGVDEMVSDFSPARVCDMSQTQGVIHIFPEGNC